MNFKNIPNINVLWGALIVEELTRQGGNYFCLSSGSRCSPLTVAVAQNKKAKSFIHFDERALAYHALGYTSATKKPSVLIATSGTAGANFFPAIIEASKKKLPLIVLTADRPPELRKSGANQTIDQVNLFGEYVRWAFDMPCPTTDIKPEFVLTTIDQAVHRAWGSPRGPVHLNCMFREPLAPTADSKIDQVNLTGIERWQKTSAPYTRYIPPTLDVGGKDLRLVLGEIKKASQGVIVVGKLGNKEDQKAVLNCAQKLNWPIFADVTSGLKLGNKHPHCITYWDQILLQENITAEFQPDTILHFGGRMTSQRYYDFMEQVSPPRYVMVNHHPLRNDPLHNVSHRFESSVTSFCNALTKLPLPKGENAPLESLQSWSQTVEEQIEKFTARHKRINEITTARLIARHIPKDSGLFLANSMPIREMDMYAAHSGHAPVISANRGASGIDGLVATACGFAKGLNKVTTLFIGDLALLHDLNSLAMLKGLRKPLVIIVLNNNGGGIFSFLPIARAKKVFEQYFGTPHDLNFAAAASMFKLNYARPTSSEAFVKAYKKALRHKRSSLIEVKTNRSENFKLHQDLCDKIRSYEKAN